MLGPLQGNTINFISATIETYIKAKLLTKSHFAPAHLPFILYQKPVQIRIILLYQILQKTADAPHSLADGAVRADVRHACAVHRQTDKVRHPQEKEQIL